MCYKLSSFEINSTDFNKYEIINFFLCIIRTLVIGKTNNREEKKNRIKMQRMKWSGLVIRYNSLTF